MSVYMATHQYQTNFKVYQYMLLIPVIGERRDSQMSSVNKRLDLFLHVKIKASYSIKAAMFGSK